MGNYAMHYYPQQYVVSTVTFNEGTYRIRIYIYRMFHDYKA